MFRRFIKEDGCKEGQIPFKDHMEWKEAMVFYGSVVAILKGGRNDRDVVYKKTQVNEAVYFFIKEN